MKITVRLLGLLVALLAGATTGLTAQSLASGIWTGKGVGPGGEEFPITFEVDGSSDSVAITIVTPDGEKLVASEIRFEEGKLLFKWEPGVVVSCTLSPADDGGFSGPCADEEGGTGTITMIPPPKQN
jgi:hypothetical protein